VNGSLVVKHGLWVIKNGSGLSKMGSVWLGKVGGKKGR